MSLNDPLANVLSKILNAEKIGSKECITRDSSKFILEVLEIMKKNGYVQDYEHEKDGRGGIIKITLSGNINKCGVIKPRSSFKTETLEKYEKRFLPAKGLGIIIVSTPKGLMTHEEAIEKNTGGILISYIY